MAFSEADIVLPFLFDSSGARDEWPLPGRGSDDAMTEIGRLPAVRQPSVFRRQRFCEHRLPRCRL